VAKVASVGVRNPSLSRTGLALHRIDFVSSQRWLLHPREARAVAGRTRMLSDLRHHGNLSGRLSWRPHFLAYCSTELARYLLVRKAAQYQITTNERLARSPTSSRLIMSSVRFKNLRRPDRRSPGFHGRKPSQPPRISHHGCHRMRSGSRIRRGGHLVEFASMRPRL
jgi:hypothetical protein